MSILGLGAGALGAATLDDREAERLLGEALDLGVTLIDTARSYGLSEERIGRFLGPRRREVVLATKGGYGVSGVPDWTGEAVRRGIDEALVRLRTDCIDVFHLHSCPPDVVSRDDITAPLTRAREAGKIKVAGYSGENEALGWAVQSGVFGGVECSVNVCDQASLQGAVREASARGIGVLAKRALANVAWRFAERPRGDYAEVYWERLQAMKLNPAPLAWTELAARFSAFAPGVSAILVGTSRPEHLREVARGIERGPLPDDVLAKVHAAFAAHGAGWGGEI